MSKVMAFDDCAIGSNIMKMIIARLGQLDIDNFASAYDSKLPVLNFRC